MPRKNYWEKLNRDNEAVLEKSRNARDIAEEYPPPGDMELRGRCEFDLKLFYESYFPNAFNMEWADDHIKAIDRMEQVILRGGLFALAMPRGSGKTSLSLRAALWALLYGHRRFVSLIGATEGKAKDLMKQIKAELMYNETLKRDFRQVCYPIERLENNGRKAIGQLYQGNQTNITWGVDRLTFPVMPDEACDGPNVSGYLITTAGITGAIRGQSHVLPNGLIVRPEIAILDDPQTRESAMSKTQCQTRAKIINGDVLGMAGPGQKIAAIMPCTVVKAGDMAEQMLDRKVSPEWTGHLMKMVYQFPKNTKLWDEYENLLIESLQSERNGKEATEFYRENRLEMDEGASVAWLSRKDPDDESAIEHAMRKKILSPEVFFAEYQNEPLPELSSVEEQVSTEEIIHKINRIPRGVVPRSCHHVTGFIDVQKTVLYWMICAWESDFTGYIVDYGVFPDQKRLYFSARDARNTLAEAVPRAGFEGQIYGGLDKLTHLILGRDWMRDDGAAMKVDRCPIDAGWGQSTETVRKFCRQSKFSSVVIPSHGRGIKAGNAPMSEWQKKPGEKTGLNWKTSFSGPSEGVRRLIFDTNYWKSFVSTRLAVPMGDKGCLSLFGDKPNEHKLLADHLTSEYRVQTEGRGRTCDEWMWKPEKFDNHWFDCLVGSTVAASMQGVTLSEGGLSTEKTRKRVSFSEIQRQKRA